MNIFIKRVDVKNYAPVLFKLDVNIFTRSYHRSATSLETFIQDYGNCSAYLVYDEVKPVGFMVFEDKSSFIEIYEFGLLPQYQHKGIGTLLLQDFLKRIKNKKIHLLTHPFNSIAIIFYLKYGFTLSAWKDDYYKNGQPRVLLKKEE